MTHLAYLEAAVAGPVQGVTKMFPAPGPGHAVGLTNARSPGLWGKDRGSLDDR